MFATTPVRTGRGCAVYNVHSAGLNTSASSSPLMPMRCSFQCLPRRLKDASTSGKGEKFMVHDFRDEWPESLHGEFDLVHQRLPLSRSEKQPTVNSVKRFQSLLRPGTG